MKQANCASEFSRSGDRAERRNLRGYAAVFATVVIWSTPSLFQYYLNRYYDPWAQNFYRYLVACLAIAPLLLYRVGRGTTSLNWQAVAMCFIPCLPNVVHQITQVVALFYVGPGVYTIFTRASVIFTALLALAFFPEERRVIRQWQFQVGTVIGLVGAFGVVWFQAGWASGHIALPGFLIAFTATFCWALYGILIKRPSARLGPICSFSLVSLITTILLLPLTFLFGDIGAPAHSSAQVNLVLIISAVTCITLAHLLYYVAIQEIGVALAQSLQLLCPAGAMGLSAWLYGERLNRAQIWSAAILLLGAFLAMRTKPTPITETVESI